MKKIFLCSAMLLTSTLASSQENKTIRPVSLRGGGLEPRFTSDVIVENNPTLDQRDPKVSVAFNGWLYAAYTTVDNASNSGGVTIRTSRDNGLTWSAFDSYIVPASRYTSCDIVITGTDTNSLKLFLVGIRKDISTPTYILYIDTYDGRTTSFTGSIYNYNAATRPIYDVAIASDYEIPAAFASPFSVGVLYSTYSSMYDSIVYIGSSNGGASMNLRQPVAVTGAYCRNVSIAYGRSASASNGRYFGAWEQLSSSTARNGHIYTSHNASLITGPWITPVNLDSISAPMINLCSNPSISVQYNDTDNDSGAVTAVVLTQRDYNADGTDYDILGFYNKRAHYANFWSRLDIINNSEQDKQPNITYARATDKFYATYFDSTHKFLPVVTNGFNLTSASTWTNLTPKYNDDTINVANPAPCIRINPAENMAAMVWAMEGVSSHGIVMFDAEYNTSGAGIASNDDLLNQKIFPVPADDYLNIAFEVKTSGYVKIQLTNLAGQVISSLPGDYLTAGQHYKTIDVSGLPAGLYLCTLVTGTNTSTRRIEIKH